jgi:hypothetical protein
MFDKKGKRVKKIILTTTLLCSCIVANELEYEGEITAEFFSLRHDLDKKRDKEVALRLDARVKYQLDSDKKIVVELQGVGDVGDEERRYIDFANLYFEHSFKDSAFLIGRSTRTWGAMEFYSHTDNFNTKNWLDNPFDFNSKLGAWNFSYTHRFRDAEISVITKLYEEKQEVQDRRSPHRFLPLRYSSVLETSRDRSSPTVYLKYSPLSKKDGLDYSVIFQRGYDEQRYLAPMNSRDENSSIRQHAYIVDKLMGYATFTKGDTKYKTELAYTQSEYTGVADYAQGSLGIEHTLKNIYKEMDLGFLVEYYEYKAFQTDKLNAKSFEKLIDDDVALGIRLSQNDKYNSELLGGVMVNRHNKEKIYFMEYATHLSDKYKLGVNLQHLAPHKGSIFGDVDTIKVDIGYHF